ncbi:fungal-specific transcription factor domain-containing protein [Daldinia vernicosa]|uniref:fungal-specific transcription factor domain-containing protein n=1 Tax=Daldinia vernicosa TaxID=114800 RepID=UPI002007673B|nr:fungal-specific transcription factor domain-containing protein [Daldinia vernicosa]KAI0845951.1 fungal-specific transcription factor domain-containing protein [Daldinia vernicosa]
MSHVPTIKYATATPDASGGLASTGLGVGQSSETNANASRPGTSLGTSATPGPKPRSCVTCRTRKVRCDKTSPCSNCRRARIPCVFPSSDKPPRWARRLERIANNAKAEQEAGPGVSQVMDRLRNLEDLVKELSSQLEQAHSAANTSSHGSPSANSPGSSSHDHDADRQTASPPFTNSSNLSKQFGRLVLGDAGQSHYVSNGFWSRVNDEIEGLKMETEGLASGDYDSSEDEDSLSKTPFTQELDRTPSQRHAFLFGHNLSPHQPNIRELHPPLSQISFSVNVFYQNVNVLTQVVHMPTLNKMVQSIQDSGTSILTPANEALMFAIYYSAITSMEEEDVVANLGSSKSELNLKYRLGLEYALAKADFLNVPDVVLIQAFAIFLCLARRYDSPRFVYMMTGLVIRMALALGLHRDGSHFPNLTPFEAEMRRRLWWHVCLLDVRASEDQGMDLTIIPGSFDTRQPLNINDDDIDPEKKEMPKEREGITDMTFSLMTSSQCEVTREMMAVSLKDGVPQIDVQDRLLNEYYERLEKTYLQYSSAEGNVTYWVVVVIARLVMAKMSLIVYFPVLFSPESEHASDEMRNRLFIAAIEVAEYNHTLNAEQACRQWRWIYQTYTHWYAVVYLLIEMARRPWSPLVERAWVALHSNWLIPPRSSNDKNLRFWVPLRKLMAKARRHREAEIERLRSNPQAARQLETEDRGVTQPSSSGPFPGPDSAETFRERWRQLVTVPRSLGHYTQTALQLSRGVVVPPGVTYSAETNGPGFGSVSSYYPSASVPGFAYPQSGIPQGSGIFPPNISGGSFPGPNFGFQQNPHSSATLGIQSAGPAYGSSSLTSNMDLGPGFGAWLWADADPSVDVFADVDLETADLNVDLDGEVDWNNWVASANGMNWLGDPAGGNRR